MVSDGDTDIFKILKQCFDSQIQMIIEKCKALKRKIMLKCPFWVMIKVLRFLPKWQKFLSKTTLKTLINWYPFLFLL